MIYASAYVIRDPVFMGTAAKGPNLDALSVVVAEQGQQETTYWVVGEVSGKIAHP